MSKSRKHLSLNDRILILQYINENLSMREIGKRLGFSASTISRELESHRKIKKANSFNNYKDIHGCKNARVSSAPWVCHGCKSYIHCRKDKYIYVPTEVKSLAARKLFFI